MGPLLIRPIHCSGLFISKLSKAPPSSEHHHFAHRRAAGRRRAMIRHLRALGLSFLFQSPSYPQASCISPRGLLSTAASTSPEPFVVEDYLVERCGLTRARALKASRSLSHLKSPCKSDAVLDFLSGLGVPRSDVAALVACCPLFLCSSVERTLAPRVAELKDLGLSRLQIARLIPLAQHSFHSRNICGNLSFWLSVFDGSFETLLRAVRLNSAILRVSIDKKIMPNLAFLRQCGISVSELAVMNMYSSRLFNLKPMVLQEAAERVEELGIERESGMFRRALAMVALMSKEFVSKKIELLHKIGFSQDDALVAVRKAPLVLRLSEEKIRRVMGFLTKDVGLEAPYIAQRPVLFSYSLEGRLMPRYFLLNVLRQKGLLTADLDYYYTAALGEKKFLQKFVHPYKDHVPGLTDDYASLCPRKTAQQEI